MLSRVLGGGGFDSQVETEKRGEFTGVLDWARSKQRQDWSLVQLLLGYL